MANFFLPGDARDDRYRILRDDDLPVVVEARAFVEELWAMCQEYLDDDLPSAAMHSYLSRFWELYVCASFIKSDRSLVARSSRMPKEVGPDLLLRDPKIWVEAVLPSVGIGPDAVPGPLLGQVQWVPDDQIILRFRQVIEKKHRRYQEYVQAGWVQPSDPYVIAVGGGGIIGARLESAVPRIVRCVLPLGAEQLHIDRSTLEVVALSYAHRSQVTKSSGAPVSTDLFQDACYSGISGVLYGWVDEINHPEHFGDTCIFLHNPLARSPLPHGTFRFGREYWVEDDKLFQRSY